MEEKTIEQSFEELEQIIDQMENSDVTLDQSFELYKKGMEELQAASAKIEQTKKAVMAINSQGQLDTFEEDSDE